MVGGIEAPITGDEVKAAITVEVAGGESSPPAGQVGEAEIVGDLLEVALVVQKDAKGTPGGGQDQIGRAVGVEVGPEGSLDGANFGDGSRVGGVQDPALIAAFEDAGGTGEGEASGQGLAAEEEVEITVAIDISEGEGAVAGVVGEEDWGPFAGGHDMVEGRAGDAFVGGGGDEDGAGGGFGDPPDGSDLVAGGGGGFDKGEGGIAGIEEEGGTATATSGNEEVVELIVVEVEPGEAGAGLAEAKGEERLALEIVEGSVEMAMTKAGGLVGEKGQ